MIGSGIVALPYTFHESGVVLGLIITLLGLVISYRTCILIIRATGNDDEYFQALYKYLGSWAYYTGYISTLLIMVAAVCSYFLNLSQMLYSLILALVEWIFGKHFDKTTDDFSTFSLAYIAIAVFFLEFLITNKKDLSIFIKMISFGSAFIISLMVFLIGFGFYGFSNTEFIIVSPS
jgi:amino acid permease